MSIQFESEKKDEEIYTSRTILGAPQVPGMTKVLMKTGLSEAKAYKLLVIILFAILIIAGFILFKYGGEELRPFPANF
jgi:hypothetical protein